MEKQHEQNRPLIAVIGGGAAGLAAAIAAAETAGARARVVVCEAADRVGKPILATGNGRCNFSNARLADPQVDLEPLYRNAEFVAAALEAAESAFPKTPPHRGAASNAVLRFFRDHGLLWREEGEGRLYPLANKASSVLDVLRAAAEDAQVEALVDFRVRDIGRGASDDGEIFEVRAEDGRRLAADEVIVAVGGSRGASLAESLGLPFVTQRPVLGPLAVDAAGKRLTRRLDNVRVKAAATLLRGDELMRREQGEVLFRAYGLSGICIFDLSRDAEPRNQVALDLLAQLEPGAEGPLLAERAATLEARTGAAPTCDDVLRGMVLPSVGAVLCERAGLRGDAAANDEALAKLAAVLRDLRFTVEGTGDARQCQVKRGGVAVDALDSATLEANAAPGLFVVGEAVDVDGACGGFNLHWAWASGMLAGRAAAERAAKGR